MLVFTYFFGFLFLFLNIFQIRGHFFKIISIFCSRTIFKIHEHFLPIHQHIFYIVNIFSIHEYVLKIQKHFLEPCEHFFFFNWWSFLNLWTFFEIRKHFFVFDKHFRKLFVDIFFIRRTFLNFCEHFLNLLIVCLIHELFL